MDIKSFYKGEMAFLIGLKVMVEQAMQRLNDMPCVIDNSHQWEQLSGFVEQHLQYLYELGYCSKELKQYYNEIREDEG